MHVWLFDSHLKMYAEVSGNNTQRETAMSKSINGHTKPKSVKTLATVDTAVASPLETQLYVTENNRD